MTHLVTCSPLVQIREIASALAYLHDRGIIHGDMKAANVLVSDEHNALLCDFGLSRAIDTPTATTLRGKGSLRWMSPELLCEGEGKSFASDIWAFSMTVYEVDGSCFHITILIECLSILQILSGCLPFHDLEEHAIISTLIFKKRRPPLNPECSLRGASYMRIWKVAQSCWNEDPRLRPSMTIVSRTLIPTPDPETFVRLQGHTESVTAIAFSPHQSLLASASVDLTIRFWSFMADEWTTVGDPLLGHTDDVNSVAFSPDGTLIVSGSDDWTICLWDVASGQLSGEPLVGHTNWVWSTVFSPDGRIVASASGDRTIRLWDTGKRACLAALWGHSHWVRSLAFSSDGRSLASASSDRTIRLWDVKTMSQIGPIMEEHTRGVACVSFSADSSTLVSGSSDTTVRVWDMTSESPNGIPIKEHGGYVNSVACARNGRLAASASSDGNVHLWNLSEPISSLIKLTGRPCSVNSVAFSFNGRWLASGSSDGAVQVWEIGDVESAL